MATFTNLTIETSRTWWLDVYLQGVLIMVSLTGGEPDMDKVLRMIVRGMRWRFAGARRWNRF
jgi:hypothetical protein